MSIFKKDKFEEPTYRPAGVIKIKPKRVKQAWINNSIYELELTALSGREVRIFYYDIPSFYEDHETTQIAIVVDPDGINYHMEMPAGQNLAGAIEDILLLANSNIDLIYIQRIFDET